MAREDDLRMKHDRTIAAALGFLAAAAFAWAQTHIVLTTDQQFTVATGRSLTGTYQCSGAGAIVDCPISGGSGFVASVGLTMPGIFSVAGSPVTTSGTLAVTANGTSGGIPYFNAATTMASSAALGADQVVLGGGAGAAPTSSANFTFDDANFRLRAQNLTTATDNSLNMVQLSGTMPAVPTVSVAGGLFSITSAGSAAQQNGAFKVIYNAGYTGSDLTYGLASSNAAAGTGTNLRLGAFGATNIATANTGAYADAIGSGAGDNIANQGVAGNSTSVNVGGYFRALGLEAGSNIGGLFSANGSTEGTGLKDVALAATLGTALPVANINVALLADNGAIAAPIFNAYDNGTLVFSITDGGPVSVTSTFKSTAASDLGWVPQNAANQACNTTCTVGACVAGIDTAALGNFLACTDATADSCLCAG